MIDILTLYYHLSFSDDYAIGYYIKNTVKLLLKSYSINVMLIITLNILIIIEIDIFINCCPIFVDAIDK